MIGYLNSNETYRPDQLSLGLTYIDRGIKKFPKRLDMRFGKCYALQQIADYNDFATELISTVSYSDYELSEKYGDAEAKQQAKKMLQALRR